MDPPFGEERYAYQPVQLKHTTRSESTAKEVVIIPPIRIEATEAVKINSGERLRNSVVKVSPKELTEKEAEDKPETDKIGKGKELSKTQKRISSDDQDRNNMKIEKLRKTASSSRPESNEFSTLFFSPPRKDSSRDSGSSRRDSKLEQRRNTPEAFKTPTPLSRKEDKQKLEPKINEKTVSGKHISSAPILILSDTETDVATDQNRSPEILPNRSQDQRKIFIIPLDEEPADVSKNIVSTLPFPTGDRNKAKEHDSKPISDPQVLTPMKHFPKDIAGVAKQEINKPPAKLSNILSSDVIEIQQDNIIESGKGSLVMSPITEIIIPPVGKLIRHSQTDESVKGKPESFDKTRKRSSSQLKKNDFSDPSNITNESILKEPVKIEKLRASEIVKAKLPDDNYKAMSPKNVIETQETDKPRIPTKSSDPIELVNIIKQPIGISKDHSDKKQELKALQNPTMNPDHYLIDGELPVTEKEDVNQYQSKDDKKFYDQMKIIDHAEQDDLLKNNYRPSISLNRTDISVKTKNEDTQLQPDQPKKDSLIKAPNRNSNASGYKKVGESEIKIQSRQSLNEELKKSLQLQEHHEKPEQHMITEEVQKLRYMPVKLSEPHQPTAAQDSPNANYQEMDTNLKHYPSTIQDIKITQAYDAKKQQLFEPKDGNSLEGKDHGLLNDSQVSRKGVNRDDPHYINLVFQKYTYDDKTGIKTLDADSNFEPDENIVTYKSNSNTQDKKITIPIDGQHVMAIKIKKSFSEGNNDEEELLVPSSNIRKYLF